jgi:CRISPR system Cascade subunit CasE
MSLHLVQLRPDSLALATWATRHGLLSPDGDYGYALHALLSAAFGNGAPKPFRYLDAQRGLLAYSHLDLTELRERAALAVPEMDRALGLASLDARAFPTDWRSGQRVAFEVRTRPVVRTNDGHERDAFLHAIATTDTEAESGPRARVSRADVYSGWITRHITADGAAEPVRVDLAGFRLTRVLRRPPKGPEQGRKSLAICGPDALFQGELRVGDGEAFARLVARGVGRHCTFGFGMLLLKPPC